MVSEAERLLALHRYLAVYARACRPVRVGNSGVDSQGVESYPVRPDRLMGDFSDPSRRRD